MFQTLNLEINQNLLGKISLIGKIYHVYLNRSDETVREQTMDHTENLIP